MDQIGAGTRVYVFRPRMTARDLSRAMRRLGLSAWALSRLTGMDARRIRRMLKGEPGHDVPVLLQALLFMCERSVDAMSVIEEFAVHHAHEERR